MTCSQRKEIAVAILYYFSDSSNEEDGNETEVPDHEIKLFEGAATDPVPPKTKGGWKMYGYYNSKISNSYRQDKIIGQKMSI